MNSTKGRTNLTNSVDEMHFMGKNKKNYKNESKNTTKNESQKKYGIGLDVGTGFLVSSRFTKEDKITYLSIRDCFFKLEKHLFNPVMFNQNKMKYIETETELFIIGEDALTFARIRNQATSRPLSTGIINPKEKASAPVLREIFRYIIQGHVSKDSEKLVFSIPGPMVGSTNFDTTYHAMSIQSLTREYGVEAIPMNEAFLVNVSELGKSNEMTGLSFSFGAGMVNCCLTFKSINLFEFSLDKSGDFIDKQAASAVGESESMISHIKENTLDLTKDDLSVSAEERALIFSYRFIIQQTLAQVKFAFNNQESVTLLEPIPVIISGGTSLPNGFIDLFEQELKAANLPFKVTKIIKAQNPLNSVAKGALIWANSLENKK